MSDFFVDYDDTWMDTDDDFWYPLDTVPINARNAILQDIVETLRVQPISIPVLTALMQHIAESDVTLFESQNILSVLNVIFKTKPKSFYGRFGLPFGSVAWAYGMDPDELMRHFGGGYYLGPFTPGWSGTGQVVGNVASERLAMDQGEYMQSYVWNTGRGTVKLQLEKYSRKSCRIPDQIRYRTGATISACDSALWNTIKDGATFDSLGYAQIRLGSTAAGIPEGEFYSHGGFDWEDDGGFNWD